MVTYKKKYNRYLLTYPMPGNKVYKTNNLDDAIKKCYKEFKTYNDIKDGYFGIVNIDTNEEYQFTAQNNNIYRMKDKRKNKTGGGSVVDAIQDFATTFVSNNNKVADQETSSVGPTEELTISPITEMM